MPGISYIYCPPLSAAGNCSNSDQNFSRQLDPDPKKNEKTAKYRYLRTVASAAKGERAMRADGKK